VWWSSCGLLHAFMWQRKLETFRRRGFGRVVAIIADTKAVAETRLHKTLPCILGPGVKKADQMLSLPPDLCPTLPYRSLTTIHSAILNSCYILPHPCLSFCMLPSLRPPSARLRWLLLSRLATVAKLTKQDAIGQVQFLAATTALKLRVLAFPYRL
jgi:hypothetical protein